MHWGGAFSASAQTPGGVVIRERVEVSRPATVAAAAPSARTLADPCASPATGYAVFVVLPSFSRGAPLDGLFAATSPCGNASAALASGLTLVSVDDYLIHSYDTAGELLRLPLAASAPLPTYTVTVGGETRTQRETLHFGCYFWYTSCTLTPGVIGEAGLDIRLSVEGRATDHAHAWPDTVACGTTTPLPVTLTRADGTEGYVGPDLAQTFQLPGAGPDGPGMLRYDGATGDVFYGVPYADTRAGAVTFVAPACAAISFPTFANIWVTGLPYGTGLFDAITVLPEPPAALRVTVTPDTLVAGGASTVRAIAVTASGNGAAFDEATPVTLSASGAGVLAFRQPYNSSVLSGAAITIPYSGARGASGTVTFTAAGTAPERDTPVTITAAGGGLSGDTTLVVLGRLRLDLVADPSALPNGGASRLYATVRGAGASSVPASAPLTFTLADPSLGTLYRRSTQQRGATLTGVPRPAAAQGDVVFDRGCSGPASPAGVAHITAAVDGWADLMDDVSISVGARLERDSSSAALDTLYVSFSSSTLAAGDSAVMHVSAPEAGSCGGGGSVLPDSTMMSVVSFAGPFGLLEYNGTRSRSISDITWGELKAGEVQFIATGAVPCAADTVGVIVSSPGLMGGGSVIVQGGGEGRAARSADAPMCTSRINLVETTQHLSQAFRDACPRMAGFPVDSVRFQYERTLTEYLFGGMGWGTIPEYTYSPTHGLDGYLRWGVDTNGRRYPQVGTIMEAKMTNGRPVNDSDGYAQAVRHMDFLANQRTAFRQAFLTNNPNGITFTFGDPTLIYVSQSQGDGDFGWRVGSAPFTRPDGPPSLEDYDRLILDHANSRHVAIMHARMVQALGYRTLILRYRTPLRIIDPQDPIMDWLSEHAAVDLRALTFSTFFPISLECGPNPRRQESPPPPGWNP